MANTDVYQAVTDQMIAALEAGTAPWRKPWTSVGGPRNIEGKPYRGVNVFILHAAGAAYTSPIWLTFNQTKKHGGTVRKGEKSTLVVFWKVTRFEDKATGEKKTVPMLRYYRVFNLDQTDGVKVPPRTANAVAARVEHTEPLTAAQAIVDGWDGKPTIGYGPEAFYSPALDTVTVPEPGAFTDLAEHYSALFHELAHSTGHTTRLNRFEPGAFGSHAYGREELVAEMTTAFLAVEAGIETTHENSAAYLASWVRTIKADPKAIVTAAGKAQKAADLILGRAAYGEAEDTEVTAATEVALAA